MLEFWLRSPLFEEAPPDGPAPGGGPPPFDPAAFKAEIMGEFNKGINAISKQLKAFKPDPAPALPVPDPAPNADPTKPVDPEKNALLLQIKRLTEDSDKRIKALETTNQETASKAETTDRESKIRSKLADYAFVNESAKETAFQLFKQAVTRSDDGALVAGDLPFDKFIETELPGSHAYLLAPKDVSGSGARKGGQSGPRKFTLEDIDNIKTLPAEDQLKLRQEISANMQAAQSGR